MTLVEYYKQILTEDLGTERLMKALQDKEDVTGRDTSLQRANIAHSPNLYDSDPSNPSKPKRVRGARLSRDTIYNLARAADSGASIPKKDVKTIKDFIRKHGHFVGGDDIYYPDTFRTNDPNKLIGNVFGSTRKRRK